MKKKYRIEFDTKGPIKVENTKFCGAQTQRSLDNFKIGSEKFPVEVISALGYQKKAAAMTNMQLKKLDNNRVSAAIIDAETAHLELKKFQKNWK